MKKILFLFSQPAMLRIAMLAGIFYFLISNLVFAQPPLPEVNSPTHSDQAKWYSNNNPKFQWMLPRSVDGINVLADENPATDPGEKSDGWFNHTSYLNTKDGIWYFHIKFLTGDEWGPIAHFKFQIDTEKPTQLEINQLDSEFYNNGRFSFDASDKTSGIDYFAVKIDDEEQKIWRDYGDGVFQTPELSLGEHKISAKVFDKAGNFIEKSESFLLEKILPPRIISSRRVFKIRQNFAIQGVTYRDAPVDVWIKPQNQPEEVYNVQSDSRGLFSLEISNGLPMGNYTIWAGKGEKINIVVEPNFVWVFVAQVLVVVALFIPFIALTALIMFIIWYLWHKLNQERKSLRKKKKS